MAAVEKEDPEQVRAAQILVNLRDRKLRKWPEWVPMQPPGTVAAAAKMMPPPSREASSSAGAVAARVVPPQRVISMQSGQASLSLAGTVAAGVLTQWPKAKRSGWRGDTSKELQPEQGHVAAAAKGSGAPRPSEQERCAEMPAQGPVVAALCYAAVAGSGPSTSAAPASKEPMKTPSPDTPLDYGAGGSGAPSSADDAASASARPQAKRKGTGDDDEGCRSPAKRGPVVAQEEEKPMPTSAEPSGQSEARASGGKAAPRPFDFDLNLLPCTMDDDDGGCPDTT